MSMKPNSHRRHPLADLIDLDLPADELRRLARVDALLRAAARAPGTRIPSSAVSRSSVRSITDAQLGAALFSVAMNAVWRSRHRRTLAIAVAPSASYLLVLVVIALLVRPPLLGWIGLGVVALASFSIAALALYLWPRSRVNTDRLHPHSSTVFRLLVVIDADLEPEELARAVAARTGTRPAEVRVVAPAGGSPLHLVTSDSDNDGVAAAARLSRTLRTLGAQGRHLAGTVGAPDPLEATGDELSRFAADEILFVGREPDRRRLLDEDFERRARDLFGVHCSTLYGR